LSTAVDNRTTLQFGPNRYLGAGAGVGAIVLAVLVVTTDDRGGRLLYALAALVLAAVCAFDLIWNPRLVATPERLRLRSPAGSHDLSWPQVDAVRVDERTRLGLASATLEIDAGDLLVVLSRHALNADPREVAGLVEAMRISAPGSLHREGRGADRDHDHESDQDGD
jgi:hypothetical protein